MCGSRFRDVVSHDRLVVARYKSASKVLGLTPPSIASLLAYCGGFVAFVFSPNKRRIVIDNLSRASGGSKSRIGMYRLGLGGYFSYARYWVESLAVGELSRRQLNSRMSFQGFEYLYQALGEGKGAIVTSPHMGNWDFGAAWLASAGFPITAVTEELEPLELFEWFVSHRISFGVRPIPASAAAFGELTKALSRNEVVALVADRDVTNSGVQLPFFGEVTSVPQGVALLSLRTGAPIIPVAIYLLPGGFHFALVTKPISFTRSALLRDDVSKLTGMLVERYESLIRADPTQWHLFQVNWPSQFENFQQRPTI